MIGWYCLKTQKKEQTNNKNMLRIVKAVIEQQGYVLICIPAENDMKTSITFLCLHGK